jgi:hypothetical protein
MGEGSTKSVSDTQASARIAGFAYLITIVAGLFAQAYARGTLLVPGDAASTAARLMADEWLYRSAIFADLVMLGSYIVVTALVYRIFKAAAPAISLCAAFFSLTGIALLAANTGLLAGAPILLGKAAYLGSFSADQLQSLAFVFLRMHGEIYGFTGAFFGPYCLAVGWLVLRSRLMPRLVGWLMMLAGATFVLDLWLDLLAPAISAQVPAPVMAISLLGEGAFAIWLAIFGVFSPAPRAERLDTPTAL